MTKIIGILNLTLDSFSDGGKFNKDHKSFKQIEKMRKKIIFLKIKSKKEGQELGVY